MGYAESSMTRCHTYWSAPTCMSGTTSCDSARLTQDAATDPRHRENPSAEAARYAVSMLGFGSEIPSDLVNPRRKVAYRSDGPMSSVSIS